MTDTTEGEREAFAVIETVDGADGLGECRVCGAVVRFRIGSGDGADRHAEWHADDIAAKRGLIKETP